MSLVDKFETAEHDQGPGRCSLDTGGDYLASKSIEPIINDNLRVYGKHLFLCLANTNRH